MISVDAVYQTVQKLLNKEQRGYLPPIEFNLFANMAQTEIFEQYFYDLEQFSRAPSMSEEYGDIAANIDELIVEFETTSPLSSDGNYPDDFYRLGTVMTGANIIVDETSHKEAAYVFLSPLTTPTATQPIYVKRSGGIDIYPEGTAAYFEYIRRPSTVTWAYNNINSKPIYNATNSTDFELHSSELPALVVSICALAGVAVRAVDVSQAMQAEEASMMNKERQ